MKYLVIIFAALIGSSLAFQVRLIKRANPEQYLGGGRDVQNQELRRNTVSSGGLWPFLWPQQSTN
jgi:hypothetical protein